MRFIFEIAKILLTGTAAVNVQNVVLTVVLDMVISLTATVLLPYLS